MSKTIKNCFYEKLTFENMLSAYYRARKNKKNKKEIMLYELDLESNIIHLIDSIANKTYRLGKYRTFTIHEPKKRVIKALPFKDRIVHQWYIEEFIKPFFVKRFIFDSYACIENKGTHKATARLQSFMRAMKKKYPNGYYIIQCDIKKYFYNIHRDKLYSILKRNMKDENLLSFTKIILDSEEEIGIPIGNYTSQYFANIYLNELDHYVKEKLRVKYYIRYMDDFLLLVPTKIEAKKIFHLLSLYIETNLYLELNRKSRYYPSHFGCNFCGYKIYETHILLRNRYKKSIKKKIKIWNRYYLEGKLDLKKTELQWNSCLGHASHACSHNFLKKICTQIPLDFHLKKIE